MTNACKFPLCECSMGAAERCNRPKQTPVEGLDTVAVQYEVTASNWTLLKPVISEPKNRRELVTRSQALEALEAKP